MTSEQTPQRRSRDILSWGWQRAAIALAAGALSVLAMAPFDPWPVLFISFPVAVWLIDGAGAGRSAAYLQPP